MTATLRHAAGNLLVVGLAGLELTSLERAWLRLVRPAGVILFRRNIADPAQTRALLEEVTGLCSAHAFRCADVEGGTVDRLRDALAPLPSAQAVARAAQQHGKDKRAKSSLPREHGELVARGVRAFGFNTALAPVLDLALPASAAVLGTRSPASDVAGILAYARPFLAGLAAHGVAGCGKHFPGLAGGMRDSHLETPAIERGWNALWREDLAPYRELCRELPMIMVNHAAYPATPSKDRPASTSKFWITMVLRQRLRYRGLIFSDDMEMGGILKFLPIEQAVIAAVRAGMDTMEICHSPELILRAYEALIAEGERSSVFANLLLQRARAATRQRTALFRGGAGQALSGRQFEALRARILGFRERVHSAAGASSASPVERLTASLVETA
jgi:beta-N-acetylhexosaminidase